MAGIEEAFKKFVTRVSSGEEPQSEYGDPQTGEKRIPLMQGIKRGYDFENTMPNYYNQRYDYENEMPIYQDDRYNIPQQELMGGGLASMFRERPGYAEGGTGFKNVSTTPIYSTSDYADPLGYTGKNYGYLTLEELQNLYKGNPDKINIFGKDIAPGDLISALDIFQANSSGSDPRFYIRNLPEGISTSTPTTTEVPTVDPFSGQQVSMQDQMAFAQPQADIFPQQNIFQPPSPVDQFIGERRFQSEADAAARSGIPFTKTIQDYLPNIGFNVPGHMDYFNKIREASLPQSEYNILGTADLVQRNIDQLPSVLKPAASVLAPTAAFFSSIPYEGIQAYQRMQPGSGVPGFINAYLAENPFQTMMDRTTGASQPLANLLSPTVSSAQRSQQEAAARVTPRMTMAYGGLTNTIPPAKGPDSQGVESLFRRRYN